MFGIGVLIFNSRINYCYMTDILLYFIIVQMPARIDFIVNLNLIIALK